MGRTDRRRPVEIDNVIAAEFAAMGVTAEPTAYATEDFAVWPENANSLRAWVACETQWRAVIGMAGMVWLGLDYAGVDVVLHRLALPNPDAVFADLQIMEGAALDAMHEADA